MQVRLICHVSIVLMIDCYRDDTIVTILSVLLINNNQITFPFAFVRLYSLSDGWEFL